MPGGETTTTRTGSVICEHDLGHTTRSHKSDGGDGCAESSPVNNWLILSFLWIFDFLISRLVRCFGWRRRAARPWLEFPCSRDSWLSPDPGKHCYFNQTSSDISLATAGCATPASLIPETCIRDLEYFCNAIDSLELSQRYLLEDIRSDRSINTRPDEDRRRRTIIIERKNESFGFSLQTYGIRHKEEDEVELLTYVDRVDILGPAFKAGLREGDVILSINGQDTEKADHRTVVKFVQSCEKTMRMVVLFEDCVLKVQLHTRFLKLREYERLCYREKQILSKCIPASKQQPIATANEVRIVCGSDVVADPHSHPVPNGTRNWTLPRLGFNHPSRTSSFNPNTGSNASQATFTPEKGSPGTLPRASVGQERRTRPPNDVICDDEYVTKL